MASATVHRQLAATSLTEEDFELDMSQAHNLAGCSSLTRDKMQHRHAFLQDVP